MQDFLDVVLPPVLLLVMAGVVVTASVVIITGRLRLYTARIRQIRASAAALEAARDALSVVIADPSAPKYTRDRALAAYEALGRIAEKRNSDE